MNYNSVIIYKYEISTMTHKQPNLVNERLDLPQCMRPSLNAREFEMKTTSFSILLSSSTLRRCCYRLISFFIFVHLHSWCWDASSSNLLAWTSYFMTWLVNLVWLALIWSFSLKAFQMTLNHSNLYKTDNKTWESKESKPK